MLAELRQAARALAKTPGFTAAAVARLALGFGANTAIFSIGRAVLWRPLPYADVDRLVREDWNNGKKRCETCDAFIG